MLTGELVRNFDWVLDTGATVHVTHQKSLLEDYTPADKSIRMANGKTEKGDGDGQHLYSGDVRGAEDKADPDECLLSTQLAM